MTARKVPPKYTYFHSYRVPVCLAQPLVLQFSGKNIFTVWKYQTSVTFSHSHCQVARFVKSINYSLSQNCWDTFVSSCPLNVGVQGLVTEPR